MRTLSPDQLAHLQRVRKLARFMDEAIAVPGSKFRIGFDGILGLIPVVGDLFTAGAGLFIVKEASAIGVPKKILLRMMLNLGIDFLGGAIPVAGDALDFFWKANRMNLDLLEKHLKEEGLLHDEEPSIDI